MFLQIGVAMADRRYLRFHWVDPNGATQVCEFMRWPFGLTSSPSAACWIVRRQAEDSSRKYPKASRAILFNMMMDDVLVSVPTEDEAIELLHELKSCLAEICMTIRKWASNSDNVLKTVPEEDRAKSIKFESIEGENKLQGLAPIIKTLGMVWLAHEDVFTFNYTAPEAIEGPVTNRKMLSAFMSMYDPLGLAVPFHLEARKIFQDAQKETELWDKPVSDRIRKLYEKWVAQLPLLASIRKPRLLTWDYDNAITKMIIVFTDASNTGIGACGYLRCEYEDGSVEVNLCYAKSSVAPRNSPSTPRMELEGCMSGVDVASIILVAFDDLTWTDTHFRSDSCTALAWIRQESSNLILYVRHRVGKIHDVTTPYQWQYVDTKENPADLASRGGSPTDIAEHELWWHGPKWLKLPREQWPQRDQFPETEEVTTGYRSHMCTMSYDETFVYMTEFEELMKEAENSPPDYLELAELERAEAAVSAVTGIPSGVPSPSQIDPHAIINHLERNVSNYQRMLGVIAQLLNLSFKFREAEGISYKKLSREKSDNYHQRIRPYPTLPEVTAKGIRTVEKVLFWLLQAKYFQSELECLAKHGKLPADHPLSRFRPGLDEDGIMRVMCRLRFVTAMKYDERANIMLPHDSAVTDAIMRHYHLNVVKHAGGRGTLASEFGTRFWIDRPGLKADKIIKQCKICERRDAKSQVHDFAPLPAARVKKEGRGSFQVFRDIGMDLFGPYEVHPCTASITELKDDAAAVPVAPAAPKKRGRPPKNSQPQPDKPLAPAKKKPGRPKKEKKVKEKRWIIIFTCMKIRAIHCEYLYDQSEEGVLMALERFCLARGTPETIYCDRGTYFIGAENTLRMHWFQLNERNPHLRKHFAEIEFYFNPAKSPHYGGHYERLIGLIKKAMEPLYRAPNLTDSVLYTVMRRAEHLVNMRPLAVRIKPDASDPQPLTPAHFLRGRFYRRLAEVEPGSFFEDWLYVEMLSNDFDKRFLKECAPLYNYDYSEDKRLVDFKKGDTVWLLKEKSPVHGVWPMVKVADTSTGPDGKVRTIHVEHEGKDVKTAIKDVALVLSEPEATTITTEGGLVVLPQFKPDTNRYKMPKAGATHIW
jgi:hypothetical protein